MRTAHASEQLYAALTRTLAPLLPTAAAFSTKLRRGLDGRRGLRTRIAEAAPGLQGCVWLHTTSVGEYEQSLPIVRRLREADVGPIAVTHFSPSGRDYAREHPCADHHDYLPLDRPADVAHLVAAWRPRALVFVKYDCWPALVRAADESGVPVLLLSGALSARSIRHHGPLRPFFRAVFNRFAHLGVGSEADRQRFVASLGVSAPVTVTGDTRAEQVLARFETSRDNVLAADLRAWGERRLILGSTWPRDEALWWPVLPRLLEADPGLNVIIVPHEPEPERLTSIESACREHGLGVQRLGDWETQHRADDARCLLVDRIGVLAGIYHAGDVAYVGGSFTTGVHSTLEPAAASLPVLFGPRIDNAEEALAMAAKAAGFILRRPDDALSRVQGLLADNDARRAAGAVARATVDAQSGAAERSVDLLRRYL
ncbi:hypothetical protein H8E07_18420 [bacterium]|nr:hypothetical protein [bacterium]